MDRPYTTYSRTPAASSAARTAGAPRSSQGRRSGGYTAIETDVVDGGRRFARQPSYRPGIYDDDVQDYDDYAANGHDDAYDDAADDYEDDDIYEYEESIDRRWIWVAGVAAAILLIAVICTVVILGGGDSGAVSKTVTPVAPFTAQTATSAPPTTSLAPPPVAPSAPLSPETVTTVPPSPTASVDPVPAQVLPAANTITYQVTGTRQLIDLVTVVYTDQQGALQTEFNVALPWSRTVTLNPGVALTSVTATSLTGQLNCSITDAAGATLVAQANNSMLTTCTK